MNIHDIIPAAFTALAIAHFVALLSPGQDFFLIAGHAVRHDIRGSRFICVGVALGNAVYIGLAILGWNGIRELPLLFTLIKTLGAFYLLWIGYQLFRSHSQGCDVSGVKGGSQGALKQLLLGLNSALLNPKNALFYMSLMTVILGEHVTLIQQVFVGVWMVCVVLIWDLLLASVVGHKRVQQLLQNKIQVLERGAGFVLMAFGVGLLFQSGSRS